MQGLSALVQTALAQNPFSGHVFVFRGWRGDLVKILWFDSDGLWVFANWLERGRSAWRAAGNGQTRIAILAEELAITVRG